MLSESRKKFTEEGEKASEKPKRKKEKASLLKEDEGFFQSYTPNQNNTRIKHTWDAWSSIN